MEGGEELTRFTSRVESQHQDPHLLVTEQFACSTRHESKGAGEQGVERGKKGGSRGIRE